MSAAFMLDTSFLISLVDKNRSTHQAAKQYFQRCLQLQAPLHVSTLALAEFCTKQPITDLPLTTFRLEPFNISHAIKCGSFWAALMPHRDKADVRDAVKADIQMLSQAHAEGIPYILAEDTNTFSKYAERARSSNLSTCRVILLSAGFDEAWFNDGQSSLLPKI